MKPSLERVPHHIAVIMDGNRRWAKQNGLPSLMGHWKGAEVLSEIVRAAANLGVKVLTAFAFSTENWRRSKEEIDALMELFKIYLQKERQSMIDEGVRLCVIGDLSKLPSEVLFELEVSKSQTAFCKKIDLVLAINYGGRDEIRRAFLKVHEDLRCGKISIEELSEEAISHSLDTVQWPDPEMLIRTSGEKRQSNFLLWQLCYSEFYHTDLLWPEFNSDELYKALQEYALRERRFGGA